MMAHFFICYIISVCKMVVAERRGWGRRREVKREGGRDEGRERIHSQITKNVIFWDKVHRK